MEFKALQKLRIGKNRKRLESFADEIMSIALRSTGLNAFNNMQCSSVELTAEYLERNIRQLLLENPK